MYQARPPRVPLSDAQLFWDDQARGAAARVGIDPDIFARQMYWESQGFNADVIDGRRASSQGAAGIAQFRPATARGLGIDPLDPGQALDAAAAQDRRLLDHYQGDWRHALAAYTAGQGAVDQLGLGAVLSDSFAGGETRKYVEDGLAADSEWDQQGADAVPFEVDADRQAGPVGGQRGDRDIHHGPDRSVDPAYAPGPRRVDVHKLGGAGLMGEADPPDHRAAVTDPGAASLVHMATDDAGLPLGESGWVGGVGEDVCRHLGRRR